MHFDVWMQCYYLAFTDMFQLLMLPSSGQWEQEYKYSYVEIAPPLENISSMVKNCGLNNIIMISIKYQKLKSCMKYSSMEWCTQKIHVVNYDLGWWAMILTANWTTWNLTCSSHNVAVSLTKKSNLLMIYMASVLKYAKNKLLSSGICMYIYTLHILQNVELW